MGFPGGASGKESTCQCRRHKRHELDLWIGKIPWRRKWQHILVFLPGKSMDRGAWWATVCGVARVAPNLATKPSPINHNGKEYKKCIIYKTESLCHIAEINTTL